MRVHRSALRHGVTVEDIDHAWEFAVRFFHVDPEGDRSKGLCIGPDRAGNFLEILYHPPREDPTIFHAMRLRPALARYLRRQQP